MAVGGIPWRKEPPAVPSDWAVHPVPVRDVQRGGHPGGAVHPVGARRQPDSLWGRKEHSVFLPGVHERGDGPALRLPAAPAVGKMQELEGDHPGGLSHLRPD